MSTQVMERERTQQSGLAIFRDRLLARRDELDHALQGSGVGVDRFIRTAVTAAMTTPELISDCSFQSLWIALLKACRDRLLPDGKQGAIVPYKRQAVWIPMVRGLLDRFQQSGEFKWITADFHRDDDTAFDSWIDEHGQHFLHRPGPRAGKILETYAAAITKSGAFFVTVVTEQDMARIRSVSRAKSEDAPWQQWPDQMRLKSALRRLFKLLPTPQPLDELLASDGVDDDEDAPPLAPALPRHRARGAASALEQFASEPEPTEQTAEQTAEQQTTEQQQHGESEQQQEVSTTPQVLIETAYERGKDAKKSGMKRTAMPGEYREPARNAEAIAWRNGWDGDPLGVKGTENAK